MSVSLEIQPKEAGTRLMSGKRDYKSLNQTSTVMDSAKEYNIFIEYLNGNYLSKCTKLREVKSGKELTKEKTQA
jgi:hypothetical protein